jgi:phage terminase large subunit-like protein
LFDVLQRGTRSRRQPLIVSITTAGDNLQSFCYQKYQYAKKVLSGAIEADWFLPVIFEADEKQDIYGEEAVKAANPNYPISPKPTYIQQRQALAKSSPMEENNYKRYNLNIWLQGGADKYLRMDDWLASDTEKVDWRIIEERMKGKTCYGGLDLGLVNDLSALVLIFPIEDTFVLLPYFWMPDFEMHKREPYGKWHNWVATGMVRTHVGNTLEYDLLRADIKEICSKFNVKSIAFDKQFSHQISQQLMNDRINMEQFAQYPSYYNEPMRKFLELILKKKIKHGNNEVMNWMAGNLEAITDSNGKIMPKRSKRKDKIDGMAASIMALAFAMNSEVKQAAAKSIYESRGVILI